MAASGSSAGAHKPAGRTISGQAVPRIAVRDLMNGGREVILLHEGTDYHLRLTSNGKLILTK